MAITKNRLPNITAEHPDYVKAKKRWLLIRDVIEGQDKVKSRGKIYLPLPDLESDPGLNASRYSAYLERAVFYNVTGRTVEGLTGQVFSKPAVKEFPDDVAFLRDDPAGTGITIDQQAKDVLKDLLSLGRGALWVDFPKTLGASSIKEMSDNNLRPVITYYRPEDVINWRTKKIGAKTVLSLVVLRETYISEDDGFEATTSVQYRELRLTETNVYTVRLWRPASRGVKLVAGETVVPTTSKGETFTEIPLVILGIENNDSSVDKPPLYDMATLNIGHYRNSADYEEACFMVGQPTPWFAGVTEEWVTTVLKGKIFLGSRGGIPLPVSGSAGLLQVDSNTMANEAMVRKEEQMVAIGARLVQSSGVRRTATEVTGDKVSELSVLASAALNTSEAYAKAFAYAKLFAGSTSEIKFTLSTDFDMERMTSQQLLALFTVWTGRLLTTREARDIMRRAGLATEDYEAALKAGVPAIPEASVDKQNNVDNQSKVSGQ